MNNILTLYKPPFTPADNQVIYLEWQHNESINAFIRNNYEWLKDLFFSYGLNFCYLPILGRDVIRLTYTLSPRGANAYWLASFKTSPPEYLSECMRLLREGEIPYIDMELRNSLINFYSELAEAYL